MRLAAGLVLRLLASVLLAYAAVRLAHGAEIALAIFLAVAAVGTFGMTLMSLGVPSWRGGAANSGNIPERSPSRVLLVQAVATVLR